MADGSLAEREKTHMVWAVVLIVAIAVMAVVLGVVELSKPWVITLQVATAVAGAALGNFLRLDASQSVVRNQARTAVRQLFDHVNRHHEMYGRVERYQALVRDAALEDEALDHERVGDWFAVVSADIEGQITSTATAIENWGDLALDVRNAEFLSYQSRNERLPSRDERAGDA